MFSRALALQSSFLTTASIVGGTISNHHVPQNHTMLACLDLSQARQLFNTVWPESPWVLPTDGSLVVSVDMENLPSGLEEKDKDSFSVSHIHNADIKLDQKGSFVTFAPFVSQPSNDRMDDGENENRYEEFVEQAEQEYFKGPRHQLLGYPIPLQNDVFEDDCAIMAKKVFNMVSFPEDWVLLCQFDNDDEKEFFFIDSGTVYVFIHKRDLKNQDFSRCWMFTQFC